jgi:beta-glucanase (GH16 family)
MGITKLQRGDYSENFHTFGLEWSPDYIIAYVDNGLKVKFLPNLHCPDTYVVLTAKCIRAF